MKAGIVGSSIYVAGVVPGETSGMTIIGVNYLSMYSTSQFRQTYLETFEVSGSYTRQALEIVDATREFFPLALVVESSFTPVGERITFCVETHYVLCNLFKQEDWRAQQAFPSAEDSASHAMLFLRRCKEDRNLRDSAWGPSQSPTRTKTQPAKLGSRTRARRV